MNDTLIELPFLTNWGDDTWRSDAACRGSQLKYFFPDKTSSITYFQVNSAKKICITCPVRVPCLKFAVENNLVFGVYGGVSPRDRRKMVLDQITEDTVKVRLKKAYHIMKFAQDEAPFETLSRLTGLPVEEMEGLVKGDADIFI